MGLPTGAPPPSPPPRALDSLREHVACIAHDVWAATVGVDEPEVLALVEEALAAYGDQIGAMGWGRTSTEDANG